MGYLKHLVSFILCTSFMYLTGCVSQSITYRNEKENQLTVSEEQSYLARALAYAKENHSSYKVSSKEIRGMDRINPDIRSYCSNYKHGEISVSWILRSGTIISIKSRGHLLDGDTQMNIKVVRVTKNEHKSDKELARKHRNRRGNASR